MILKHVPTEWLFRNYIEYRKDKTYISLKAPKEVVDYFKEIDNVYFEDNHIHLFFFDNHKVYKNIKIPKDAPRDFPV